MALTPQMEATVFQTIILLVILIKDLNVIHRLALIHGVTLTINQIIASLLMERIVLI